MSRLPAEHPNEDTPDMSDRARQVCILGRAEPGSPAYELPGEAGELLARLGITVISGCGSPATRVAAHRALADDLQGRLQELGL